MTPDMTLEQKLREIEHRSEQAAKHLKKAIELLRSSVQDLTDLGFGDTIPYGPALDNFHHQITLGALGALDAAQVLHGYVWNLRLDQTRTRRSTQPEKELS